MLGTNILAALLSQEDINVIHDPRTHTAYFDLEKRSLGLPVMKKDTPDIVYVGYVSHEVGHALFTPASEYIKTAKKYGKDIANIVEDARMEMRIKDHYKGLQNIMPKFYKHIFSDYETSNLLNPVKETFLERLNTYFKAPGLFPIIFNDTEQQIIDDMYKMHTFDDVPVSCKAIQEYLSEQENDSQGDESDKEEDDSQGGDDRQGDESDKEEEGDILDQTMGEYFMPSYEGTFDQHDIEFPEPNRFLDELIINDSINTGIYSETRAKYGSLISHLVAMFLRKHAARSLEKTKQWKSGKVDINKIYKYKVSEDIFQTSEEIYNAKNHGFIFCLDMSQSMHDNFHNVSLQLMLLTEFCKKMAIPFEIYGFTNFEKNKPKLIKIITSKSSNINYKKVFSFLLHNKGVDKGGTPLSNILLALPSVIRNFKKSSGVDKLKVVMLSDGFDQDSIKFKGKPVGDNDIIFDENRIPLKGDNVVNKLHNNIKNMLEVDTYIGIFISDFSFDKDAKKMYNKTLKYDTNTFDEHYMLDTKDFALKGRSKEDIVFYQSLIKKFA